MSFASLHTSLEGQHSQTHTHGGGLSWQTLAVPAHWWVRGVKYTEETSWRHLQPKIYKNVNPAHYAHTRPIEHTHRTQDATSSGCTRVHPDWVTRWELPKWIEMEEILDIQAKMNIPWQISSVCNCLGKVLCVNTHTHTTRQHRRTHFLVSIFVKGKVKAIGFLNILLF